MLVGGVERKPGSNVSANPWLSRSRPGSPLGPANQRQDVCALALGARRARFLGVGGFGLLAAVLPSYGALAFPLARFWPLAALLVVAPFFEEAFSGATCGALFRDGAAFSVIVAAAATGATGFVLTCSRESRMKRMLVVGVPLLCGCSIPLIHLHADHAEIFEAFLNAAQNPTSLATA